MKGKAAMVMDYDRDRIKSFCDKFMELNLYVMVFFLPVSKATVEVTSSLAIVAFLIKKIMQKKFPFTYSSIPLFAFIVACALSMIGVDSLQAFKISFRNFNCKLLQNALLFFIVCENMNTRDKIKNILLVMLASSFVISIDGIAQFFTHKDFLRQRIMPFAKRINAPFYTPNDLGAYLVPMTLLSLSLNFIKFKNSILKLSLNFLPFFLFVALILTFSRGAWFSFAAGLIFMVSIASLLKRKRILIVALLLIFVLLVLLPLRSDIPFNKILDFSDTGSVDRLGLWTIAWNMIKAKPIFGHGLGTFMHNFKKYDTIGYTHSVSYAHNCYLQMAAETGILGLLTFLWMVIILMKTSVGAILHDRLGKIDAVLLGLVCSLGAFLIHSGVDTNLYSLDLGALFWILLGLTSSASIVHKKEE